MLDILGYFSFAIQYSSIIDKHKISNERNKSLFLVNI